MQLENVLFLQSTETVMAVPVQFESEITVYIDQLPLQIVSLN